MRTMRPVSAWWGMLGMTGGHFAMRVPAAGRRATVEFLGKYDWRLFPRVSTNVHECPRTSMTVRWFHADTGTLDAVLSVGAHSEVAVADLDADGRRDVLAWYAMAISRAWSSCGTTGEIRNHRRGDQHRRA